MNVSTSHVREYVVATTNTRGQELTPAQQEDALRQRVRDDDIEEWVPIDDKILDVTDDCSIHIYRIRCSFKQVGI